MYNIVFVYKNIVLSFNMIQSRRMSDITFPNLIGLSQKINKTVSHMQKKSIFVIQKGKGEEEGEILALITVLHKSYIKVTNFLIQHRFNLNPEQ